MISRLAAATLLGSLLASTPALGKTMQVPLSPPSIIADGTGLSRVLLRPADLEEVRGKLVVSAHLVFDLPGNLLPADVDVEVYALSRDWDSGTVTWTFPWVRPGSDTDEEFFFRRRLEAGREATRLKLDVSAIVRAWAEGEKGEFGFVLGPPWSRDEGFRVQDLNLLGGLASGELEVRYRVTKARSR